MRQPIRAMVAMWPEITARLLPPDLRRRLDGLVTVVPDTPVTDFAVASAGEDLAATDVLITGWGCPPVDAAVLAAAPRLTAIFHAGGTVKPLLTEDAWQRGITISSAADAGAGPVADFTLAVVVLAGKRALPAARRYAAGHFPNHAQRVDGNDGRVVGVIGASRIGRRVIPRLAAAGYRVLVSDPYLDPADAAALGAELVDVDECCRRAGILSLHAPAIPATRHLIDARRLALMPDGATLINTARGALVDTEALTAACASGRIDAVLDVTDPEPLPPGHPLFSLPNVLITPHVAGVQGSELRRLGDFAVDELERFLLGEPLLGQVHRADLPILA
ncbi:hydroxyacid dehydrogenase [Dactylosporangium matsuzakiense]|uniref:Glycerate dehydrogenase n=1 Tax=Dactylosporangium matsuzakiense TaxID=53360 RepID=A0A9W6KSK9_9ACTN|nr:hydroxyacid dehydrogenase [Dactylosporangium matsuzakiense]GLL05736.1 glycerate dehydrogenase [Dactylosporangium matsuzakiense]